MAIVQQVAPPQRKPRTGGIKSVVGEFIEESRLPATTDIAWEDAGCSFPSPTRAGLYDSVTPLVYDNVVVTDHGDTFTFARTGNTVTITAVFGPGTPTGFTAPWAPTVAENHTVTGGAVVISTAGAGSQTGSPTGSASWSYTTSGTALGRTADKVPVGVSQLGAIAPIFARYAGVEAILGGDSDGSYEEQAKALLATGEDRQIEDVLWDWGYAAGSPGTATTIALAIGLAEETADTAYVGRPVLMMSRATATAAYAQRALRGDDDGNLFTPNGVPVIATGAVAAGAEQAGIVVIGQPAVYASPVIAITAIEHTHNKALAIAERVYAVGVDCGYRYKVTVTP